MLTRFCSHRITYLAALVIASLAPDAYAAPWTSVGSVGLVDEADMGIFEFINAEARVRAGAAAGSVLNLRYSINQLEGFTGPNQVAWTVRFSDNSDGARVRLFLRQYQNNGIISTLATFDSNTYPAAVGYQNQQQCIAANWDFLNGPYFIEAELTKSNHLGVPKLGMIMLNNVSCAL